MTSRLDRMARCGVAAGVAAALVACALVATGRGQGPPADPAPDLLRAKPFDRITLADDTTILVDPISPRPLPPYDPSKQKKADGRKKGGPPPEGNVFVKGKEPPKKPDEAAQIDAITVHRIDGEPGDYRIARSNIKRIDYFEDLLLAEGDRHRDRDDFARAFEHYLAVQARDPSWRGLDERANRLLFEEGSAALEGGDDVDRGLRLLRELHDRRPDYPGLADRLARAYGGRVRQAFEASAYREGRRVLRELEGLAPDHPIVAEVRALFVNRARELMTRGGQSEGAEAVDALTKALRVWPALEGAGEAYERAFATLPTLDVGVFDLPRPLGPWVRSPADARTTRLVYRPLLDGDGEEARKGLRPDQLASGLEVEDVGRRLVASLRPGVSWDDGSRTATAIDVVRALAARADPDAPAYVARWADLVERIAAPEEHRVEITLRRPALRPEAWLQGPIGPAHAGRDGRAPAEGGTRPVGDGPYRWGSSGADALILLASADRVTVPVPAPAILRVREVRVADARTALGALARGEVSLLEHVPPASVAALGRDPEVRLGRYTQPALHVIALDGRTPALRNRTLRRGLSYAIDRKTLLEETLLGRPGDDANAPTDGLFPRDSYANAPGVEPLGSNRLRAMMLIRAARQEMGGEAIRLSFSYPARPEAQAVAPKLVEAFRSAGVEITAVERPESELESDLRDGTRFDLAYRIVRCPEPIVDAGPLVCPAYDAPPSRDGLASIASDRIRQLLLDGLERAPEFPTARGLAIEIDREARDELPILPLWQVEDHFAWRTRLTGPAEQADHLYQGIETWRIAAWFATDPR